LGATKKWKKSKAVNLFRALAGGVNPTVSRRGVQAHKDYRKRPKAERLPLRIMPATQERDGRGGTQILKSIKRKGPVGEVQIEGMQSFQWGQNATRSSGGANRDGEKTILFLPMILRRVAEQIESRNHRFRGAKKNAAGSNWKTSTKEENWHFSFSHYLRRIP